MVIFKILLALFCLAIAIPLVSFMVMILSSILLGMVPDFGFTMIGVGLVMALLVIGKFMPAR